MHKLTGHSLQRGVWFEPESQPMTLTERTSTSSIILGPDAPEIWLNDWLLDDEWPEGPIVWRVKSIDDQTDTETVTVSLEHVIRLLEDTKLFDDVATSDIAGGDYCTARQAAEYLIARQSDWVLGDCPNDVSLPYEFNGGDSLLDAIESVSETLEDAEWWYDLSRYPFVLHIRRRSGAVMSEMRGGRNVSTLRRSINRTGMYTRIWPVGKNDLHISGDYISKNESLYGRVDKVETNQGKTTEDGLRAWANGLLRRHCEPLVTITISGLELSQETGEALDRIRLNRVCRCPLPEFRTTILERVIKIQWRDRKKDQESVTVTLGNNAADVRDLTKTVEETSKSGGRGARGQAKQNYLFEANGEHLLYEVFDECGHLHGILRMTSESLRTAFENLNECTRSEFLLTSESMRVQFENELASTRSEFQMTSESLRITFESEMSSARSEIEATAEAVRAKVSKGDVATQLAVECGNVHVSGSGGGGNLVVDGYIQTSELDATYINGLFSGAQVFSANYAYIRNLECSSFTQGEYTMDLSDGLTTIELDNDGNSYKLYQKHFYGGTRELVGTFSRAITSDSWSWVGGSAKVTLQPQNQSFYSLALDQIAPHGQVTWDNDSKGFTVTLDVDDTDGTTVFSDDIHFDTSASYSAGYSAVKGTYNTSGGVLSVNKSASGVSFPLSFAIDADITYDSSTHKYTAKALCDDTQMDTKESGTEAYVAGVTDGEGKFTLASVTLQGGGAYVTAINANAGIKVKNEVRYTAGSDYTLYESGSSFSYNDVGNTTVYTRSNRMNLKYVGTISGQSGIFYKVDASGTSYYQTSEFTPTKRTGIRRGNEVRGTNLGSPVAVFVPDGNGTQYYQAGATSYLYSAGRTVTDTYYTKTG